MDKRQTLRTGSIEEFVFHVWICSIYTNSSMEFALSVCPCFGGRSPVLTYDLTSEIETRVEVLLNNKIA